MRFPTRFFLSAAAAVTVSLTAAAQKYDGIIDKTIAVIGNEMITLSEVEESMSMLRMRGVTTDRKARCESFEQMMVAKLFLMQARIDSLTVNNENVEAELAQRIDHVKSEYGSEEAVETLFGKKMYTLRAEWRHALQEQSLTQQMQGEIARKAPELTPSQVEAYIRNTPAEDLPMVPIKYRLSQICVYPDKEAAAMAVKEKLLSLRERIINGEKFSTLARLYSQDPGSARRGGELGMISKSLLWPAFSDCAMSLKPGMVSQIVETPDGFHIIEVLERKGDMFNARHILIAPEYTIEDKINAFNQLDSIRNLVVTDVMDFDMAARFFSEDNATRTNGGQMSDPNTGSTYFEIDQLKPQDYAAIRNLKVGEISAPVQSLDNEGRSGQTVYKIIRLDEIVPAHTATFEHDFAMIQEQARSEGVQEVIDDFIKSKIESTYIIIDPLFGDCDFDYPGWRQYINK
ncbi:MAG: peptidylprolyl isomerase [Bacteroidales bacterium]|nr:peptidylprolyl isomerase [Bacteroidales bacterium]